MGNIIFRIYNTLINNYFIMNKEKFFYLLNNSLKITINNHPNTIFFVYNKSIDRQLKYNKLFNLNKPIKYIFNKNDILFEQDLKFKYLWIDYFKIWEKLQQNYKNKNIKILIEYWLKHELNWKYNITILFNTILYINNHNLIWKFYINEFNNMPDFY